MKTTPQPLSQRSGVLPIHKPVGPTSRGVIDEVETELGDCKIGHGGTLDPLAEGVLPLMVNEATKLIPYVQTEPKTYRLRARFDLRSESLDLGEPTEQTEPADPPDVSRVQNCIKTFEGKIQQTPPKYSAVRSDGKRLYDLNRGAKDVVPEPRTVRCHRINLLDYSYPELGLRITCGKGFYVRALVRDLSEKLELNGGVVSALVRTEYGPYGLQDSALLHQPDRWRRLFKPPRSGVRRFDQVNCSEAEIRHITNGGWIDRDGETDTVAMACDPSGTIHAILKSTIERGTSQWRPKRVLNRNDPSTPQP